MMNEEDYEEEMKHLASLLIQKMKEEQFSKGLFPELRHLKTPTDKLVYQFIMFTGPSSYTHIKKGLNLGSHGLSDSLNRMKELGVIYQIEDSRYELTARKETNEEYARIFTTLNILYTDTEKKIEGLLSEGTQRAFDEADLVAELYENLKSVIEKSGLNSENIPLVKRVKEWKEESARIADLEARNEIADAELSKMRTSDAIFKDC